MVAAIDFAGIMGVGSEDGKPKRGAGRVSGSSDRGQKRVYLKVFETLPPQMLNAYGPAKYPKFTDQELRQQLVQPLKSGGMYMTEMASEEPERRGVGINRFLQAVVEYCKYQLREQVKALNKAVLKLAMFEASTKRSVGCCPVWKYALLLARYRRRRAPPRCGARGVLLWRYRRRPRRSLTRPRRRYISLAFAALGKPHSRYDGLPVVRRLQLWCLGPFTGRAGLSAVW